MGQQKSKYQFYQESMMAQRVAHKMPEYSLYAGTDTRTSVTLSRLKIFADEGIIDPKDPGIRLVRALLNEKRKAMFATSEKVNEITKLGFMLPKGTKEVDFDDSTRRFHKKDI